MTAAATADLAAEVLAHLDEQIASARRLLASVLAQGKAIRGHDVDAVVGHMTEMRTEMTLRGGLEERRRALLARAGAALGTPAAAVTLDGLTTLMQAQQAAAARTRSSELRGLLAEIAREHGINRALMRQELQFLDHVVRLIGGEPQGAYRPGGATDAPAGAAGPTASHRAFDLQA